MASRVMGELAITCSYQSLGVTRRYTSITRDVVAWFALKRIKLMGWQSCHLRLSKQSQRNWAPLAGAALFLAIGLWLSITVRYS